MSYEGYREYICERGHHTTYDCWDTKEVCDCGGNFEYIHIVDQTNGYEEDDPYTYPASKEIERFYDEWKEDHHGNRYAIQIPIYRPASNEWKTLNDI